MRVASKESLSDSVWAATRSAVAGDQVDAHAHGDHVFTGLITLLQ